jgi:hypothetical protein
MALGTGFMVGWSQINGKANGGTQINVTTMLEVLQY